MDELCHICISHVHIQSQRVGEGEEARDNESERKREYVCVRERESGVIHT